MKLRKVLIGLLTLIMVGAALTATGGVMAKEQAAVVKQSLDNVRAYAPAASSENPAYAVDGGVLFANENGSWALIDTPENVIVNTVAAGGDQIYIGAANEMAIYRSADNGQTWLRVPLTDEYVGGVTSLAVDSAQRLVYAGTDTAGLFRLRDVGPSLIVTSHLLLDEPVREVVADSTGAGMAFARTDWNVYRAENMGLSWQTVGDLGSAPTALAMVNTTPATVYVGATDRGLLKSNDGLTWTTANEGLGMVPGARLKIDALAADPQQPGVLYVATSYLLGSTTVHQTPVAVAMSTDNAQAWTPLESLDGVAVAELMPVAGQPGAVYALMANDRTPLAMGDAPVMNLAASPAASSAQVAQASAAPAESLVQGEALTAQEAANNGNALAWIVAALAAAALLFALFSDLGKGQGGRKASAGGGLAPTLANK
jgi:hypothetical protein